MFFKIFYSSVKKWSIEWTFFFNSTLRYEDQINKESMLHKCRLNITWSFFNKLFLQIYTNQFWFKFDFSAFKNISYLKKKTAWHYFAAFGVILLLEAFIDHTSQIHIMYRIMHLLHMFACNWYEKQYLCNYTFLQILDSLYCFCHGKNGKCRTKQSWHEVGMTSVVRCTITLWNLL